MTTIRCGTLLDGVDGRHQDVAVSVVMLQADMLAVAGDPLQNIEMFEDTDTIHLIMRDGIIFKNRLN